MYHPVPAVAHVRDDDAKLVLRVPDSALGPSRDQSLQVVLC